MHFVYYTEPRGLSWRMASQLHGGAQYMHAVVLLQPRRQIPCLASIRPANPALLLEALLEDACSEYMLVNPIVIRI